MQWTPGGVSGDIEDQRDNSGGAGGGGFGGFRLGLGGFIIVAILSVVFQRNLFVFFSGAPAQAPARREASAARDRGENREVQFVSFVLNDAQYTWTRLLPEITRVPYRRARLVLFRTAFPSPCGLARDATGPFYCPEDEKVYLDLSFFDELRRRFGAPGEFAQAYVIAHELGHHVQKILGIESKVRRLQGQRPDEQNALSVRLELQADCFSGVWAHTTNQRKMLEAEDVDSALGAAAAVGDDRLQRMSAGRVSPESFTHGTSAQRTRWFRQGFNSGQVSSCNTFRGAL